jgi:uncharacterized membrane protein
VIAAIITVVVFIFGVTALVYRLGSRRALIVALRVIVGTLVISGIFALVELLVRR